MHVAGIRIHDITCEITGGIDPNAHAGKTGPSARIHRRWRRSLAEGLKTFRVNLGFRLTVGLCIKVEGGLHPGVAGRPCHNLQLGRAVLPAQIARLPPAAEG
jgi:hypothetical protein